MEKLLSLLLSAAILFSAAGCGVAPEASRRAAAAPLLPESGFLSMEGTTRELLPPVKGDSGWNTRCLSEPQLEMLLGEKAEVVRAVISTVADARAFLDRKYPRLWMDTAPYNPDTGITRYCSPQEYLDGEGLVDETGDPVIGRSDICNLLAWLVEDDLPVGILYGVLVDEDETIGPNAGANYIRTEEGYVIFDPVLGMQGDGESNYMDKNLLPEAEVKALKDYCPIALKANSRFWKLYAWEGAGAIEMDRSNAPRTLEFLSPALEPVYVNSELGKAPVYADPENIHAYALSKKLGGLTLTPKEARELVNEKPEVIREKVKTAADLLLYMLAANITDCFGDRTFYGNGQAWHYNLNAFQVMEQHVGNCGSSANLANYLLAGDYEEVGIILHAYYPGNGGGHVYNYFLYEGKYYIVDYSWYIFANYNVKNDFPVMVLSSLEEYGERCHDLYGGVCLVVAHTSPGQHLPNIFDDENRQYVLPEGAPFQVLYQAKDKKAYRTATAPVPEGVPDWRTYDGSPLDGRLRKR